MRKLIHSSFELDLSHFKISDTEENSWFSDSFFTKYSFPFEIDLEKDIDIALGFISVYNSTALNTYLDVKYIHGNTIEDAIFEVESYQNKLSCTLRFGFEQLPSFDKKLSELSLEKFDLPIGTTIYQHAETTLTKMWPEINYKFMQVHTDKYDPEDDYFNGFLKVINLRSDLIGFWQNTATSLLDNFLILNSNIMQPLPYWLHILERGMIDAGYTLSGQILEDDLLKKALLFASVDYFNRSTVQDVFLIKNAEDAIFNDGNVMKFSALTPSLIPGQYIMSFLPGKYNISGTITSEKTTRINSYFEVKYNNTILAYREAPQSKPNQQAGILEDFKINVDFEVASEYSERVISVFNLIKTTTKSPIINLTITCLSINESIVSGQVPLYNHPQVNLARAVPDITFGEFVKVVKNWFNYDLVIQDKLAVMNRIEDQINNDNSVDLSDKEVKYPFRKFSQGNSFLLKFQDINSDDYSYEHVFQNQKEVLRKGYTTDEKTTSIEINALPLPIVTREGIRTAHAFENDSSKVFLVVDTDGSNGTNIPADPYKYLIPQVHLTHWKKWFSTRIIAQVFRWNFIDFGENISNITTKSKIFAYDRFHIIKSMNKSEVKPELFDVEIETITVE